MKKKLLIKASITCLLFCASCSNNGNTDYPIKLPTGQSVPQDPKIIKSKINGAISFSEVYNMSVDYVAKLSPKQNILDFSGELGTQVDIELVLSSDTEIILNENTSVVYQNKSTSNVNIQLKDRVSRASSAFSIADTNYNVTFKSNNKVIGKFSKDNKRITCNIPVACSYNNQ